ncbi:MAG: curli-like amyloid fiber formation chaperone CsgH [Hyphomonadaceae bacterium]
MKSLLFIGLSTLTMACAANASPAPQALAQAPAVEAISYEPQSLTCDIIRTRTSHGVELRAVASSDLSAFGEYEFVVTKRDRGGSSDIMQSGEFELANGQPADLGSAEFSVARGGGYDARLELTTADGETCVAEEGR